MEDRRERIKTLSRMSRGKLLQPRFLAELSFAIDKSVTPEFLLDLQQTDLVRSRLSEGYSSVLQDRAPGFRKFLREDQQSHLLYFIDCLAVAIGSEKAILHIKNSEFCGAVLFEASTLLRRANEIIAIDGDALSILSPDYKQGMILDLNRDEVLEHYELAIWGDRWSLAVPLR